MKELRILGIDTDSGTWKVLYTFGLQLNGTIVAALVDGQRWRFDQYLNGGVGYFPLKRAVQMSEGELFLEALAYSVSTTSMYTSELVELPDETTNALTV